MYYFHDIANHRKQCWFIIQSEQIGSFNGTGWTQVISSSVLIVWKNSRVVRDLEKSGNDKSKLRMYFLTVQRIASRSKALFVLMIISIFLYYCSLSVILYASTSIREMFEGVIQVNILAYRLVFAISGRNYLYITRSYKARKCFT